MRSGICRRDKDMPPIIGNVTKYFGAKLAGELRERNGKFLDSTM